MIKTLLTLFFLAIFQASALAGAAPDGATVMLAKQCGSCHRLSKDDAGGAYSGPDLFYAGNKFQGKWLTEFLLKPEIIRIAGHITDPGFLQGQAAIKDPHPALSKEEAMAVGGRLMSLKLEGFEPGKIDADPLSKGEKVRAKILFERDYGCTACHKGVNLARKPKGGISGPSLVDAGNRLNPDWVYHWLKTPKVFLAHGRMPIFKLDETTAIQITKYLMTLKKENLR